MAMSGTVLGAQIANVLVDPSADPATRAAITQKWTDIATAIVTHIQTMAQVQVNPGQVVATAGAAGPATGATTTPGMGLIT